MQCIVVFLLSYSTTGGVLQDSAGGVLRWEERWNSIRDSNSWLGTNLLRIFPVIFSLFCWKLDDALLGRRGMEWTRSTVVVSPNDTAEQWSGGWIEKAQRIITDAEEKSRCVVAGSTFCIILGVGLVYLLSSYALKSSEGNSLNCHQISFQLKQSNEWDNRITMRFQNDMLEGHIDVFLFCIQQE